MENMRDHDEPREPVIFDEPEPVLRLTEEDMWTEPLSDLRGWAENQPIPVGTMAIAIYAARSALVRKGL